MRPSILSVLFGVQLAAATTTTLLQCNADNCLRAVRASAFPTRLGTADCSSYFLDTVTPATVVITPIATTTVTITPGATTATTAPTIAPRQVTVTPSNIPAYASACSGSVRYSSACSCIGVTVSTTTVPAKTVTTTPTTITITATASITTTSTTSSTTSTTTTSSSGSLTACASPYPTFAIQALLPGNAEDTLYAATTGGYEETIAFTSSTLSGAGVFSLDSNGYLMIGGLEADDSPGYDFSIVYLDTPSTVNDNGYIPLVCSTAGGMLSCTAGQEDGSVLQTCGMSNLYIATAVESGNGCVEPEFVVVPLCTVPS